MSDTIYPKFHVYGPKGWINDPNGLMFYKNHYHVFYQYYPDDVHWGPMHWGHAVSEDLRHWDYLEPALCPDAQDDGCFSGSAIEVEGKLYLIYTSFTNRDGVIRQQQAIAVSEDGIHFEKKGLIITSDELPEGYLKEDFRDPSVTKDADGYLMYTASRKENGKGRILVYKSKDLFHWTFDRDLFEKDSLGTMIECPDKVGDVLTFTEQFFPTDVDGNNNIHASRYILKDRNGCFAYENASALDYGFDYYAAQSFKEKNILIAWMSMWDRSFLSEKDGYAGELTYPRVLEIENGELIQKPFLLKEDHFVDIPFAKNQKIHCRSGIIHFSFNDLESLEMRFYEDEEKYAKLTLIGDELVFDRSRCEQVSFKETDANSLMGIRKMPVNLSKKSHESYLVIDHGSVEIFFDGKTLSSLLASNSKGGLIEIDCVASEGKIELLNI